MSGCLERSPPAYHDDGALVDADDDGGADDDERDGVVDADGATRRTSYRLFLVG